MHTPFARHERKRRYIASKPNVLLHFLKKETDLAYTRDLIVCANPNLGEYLIQNFAAEALDWRALSANEGLSQQTIARNLKHFVRGFGAGVYYDISAHPSVTWAFMEAHSVRREVTNLGSERDVEYKWDKKAISLNPNITMEFVESRIDYDWDYHNLSYNPNLTWKFITAEKFRINENWNWHGVAYNADFTGYDVLAIDQVSNKFEHLCRNQSLTWEGAFVKFPFKRINWYFLLRNMSVPLSVLSNTILSTSPWLCSDVLERSDITYEFVEKHNLWSNIAVCSNPNLIDHVDRMPYENCRKGLCSNPAVTIELANKYFGATSFHVLRDNQFLWDDTVYKRELARDITARWARLCDYGGLDPRGFSGIIMRYIDWE
jgi:hypothetical protein